MAQDWFAQFASTPAARPARAEAPDDFFDRYAAPARQSRTKPFSAEDFIERREPEGSAVGRFTSGAWEMLNPVALVEGVATAVRHPIATGKALVGAQVEQFRKARDAFQEGRYSEAAGHTGAGLLPVLGPLAADIGEQAGDGDVAGAAGRLAGVLVPTKAVVQGVRRGIPPRALTRPQKAAAAANAKQSAAVKWALDQDIPVDAATATGNRVVRGAKAVADSSLGGAVSGQRAAAARAETMARVGRDLARRADYTPDGIPSVGVTAETAGAGVRTGVEKVIRQHDATANAAYERVRRAEVAATHDIVQTGTKLVDTGILDAGGKPIRRAAPVMEAQQLAVPLQGAQEALRPIYDRLLRKKELTGTLQGAEGRALVALDSIVNGSGSAPLSAVDAALSDFKAAARGAAMPELRTGGQGIAAEAVKNLEDALQARAKAAGVWDDLRAGRDATIAKWQAAETMDLLRSEPVQTFRMLTSAGDSAVDRLREVRKVAPGEIPKVGRAYLDGLLDMATSEGGFGREAKLWAEWDKLGAETKSLLYPDKALRDSLDNFFLVGKKMAENPNPSGSALVGGLTGQGMLTLIDPVTGAATALSGYAVSKLLNSPTTARLLTQGLQMPRTAAAARSVSARLKHAVSKAGGPAISTAQATQATTRESSRAPR